MIIRKTARPWALAAGAVAIATALIGCSSTPSSTPGSTGAEMPAEMTTIKVGIQPPSSLAFLHLGVEQGFFEKRNLELEFTDIATSDIGVTSLLSNTIQFATTNPGVQALAASQGIPVSWVSVALTGPEERVDDNVGLYVKPDSSYQSYADLEGARVQVPCINCISDLWVRAAVENDGGDPDAVDFVVLSSADALPALENGDVDAVLALSQFVQAANAAGYRSLGDPMLDLALAQPVLAFAASDAWANQNLPTVRAFADAVTESAEFADANIDEWRAILPTYYPQQVPDAATAATINAHWSGCFNRKATETLLSYMNKYGWVHDVTVDDLFYDGIDIAFC
ncbi:ABC transporter substrate-binding protein [Herbiconiux ginsengi]|uniref:ABC-type nitrate/sulfonate/bicarbonate transport system, substrate-binding protein n=1 Tax=Herbiconiux ginsengi TaxID=381665 RepID=A0A1H3T5T2_9MICO|nr:ABC transporter substrate-binding protein [Herbiconiux ginsengi]SDZ45602.1 ABC-type nitrate/sulfonate/bicarbonate transport system, substrate-binding protein [Herbiconiux ginsengi]